MIPVLPLSLFGSVSYFSTLARFSQVTIEVWEHFPRRTFRNRYEILSPQGRTLLTIPVEKQNGSKTLAKDVLIAEHGTWRNDHLRSLQTCYRSSPYFDHYEPDIAGLLLEKSRGSFADFTLLANKWVLNQFGIATELLKSDRFMSPHFSLVPNEQVYGQVLFGQPSFIENLSVLDLLFNSGPAGRNLIVKKI